MGQEIIIRAGGKSFEGELNDSVTGRGIYEALPIRGRGQRWGGEIYLDIGMSFAPEADGRDVVEAGELGYWPSGQAFCIFFGTTPASRGEEIRAASAVNVIGKVKGELSGLWEVADGAEVVIEKAE
jgi:hypothetical protein